MSVTSVTLAQLERDRAADKRVYELPRDEDGHFVCLYQNCDTPLRTVSTARGTTVDGDDDDDETAFFSHLAQHERDGLRLLPGLVAFASMVPLFTVAKRRAQLADAAAAGVAPPAVADLIRSATHGGGANASANNELFADDSPPPPPPLPSVAGGSGTAFSTKKPTRRTDVTQHGYDLPILKTIGEGERIQLKCPLGNCPKIIQGFIYHLHSHLMAHRRAEGKGEALVIRKDRQLDVKASKKALAAAAAVASAPDGSRGASTFDSDDDDDDSMALDQHNGSGNNNVNNNNNSSSNSNNAATANGNGVLHHELDDDDDDDDESRDVVPVAPTSRRRKAPSSGNNNDDDDDDDDDDDAQVDNRAADDDDDDDDDDDEYDKRRKRFVKRKPNAAHAAAAAAGNGDDGAAAGTTFILCDDPRWQPLSEKADMLRDFVSRYGAGLFRQTLSGDFMCFFADCGAIMHQNFSRHLARHERDGDKIDEQLQILADQFHERRGTRAIVIERARAPTPTATTATATATTATVVEADDAAVAADVDDVPPE